METLFNFLSLGPNSESGDMELLFNFLNLRSISKFMDLELGHVHAPLNTSCFVTKIEVELGDKQTDFNDYSASLQLSCHHTSSFLLATHLDTLTRD